MTSKGQHGHNKSKFIVAKIKKARQKELRDSQPMLRLALKLCVKDKRRTFPNYVFPFESVY